MSEQPPEEEVVQKPCPLCAGTGKIRDYAQGPSLFSTGTYFTVDPEKLSAYDFTAISGT